MRAVRVECAFSAIEHDSRAQAGLQCISWDFRSMLGMVDGNLRIMVECITIDGLVLQIAGRHESMVRFLSDVRTKISVERVTSAKGSEGLVQKGPTLQQHRVVRLAHESGWYEAPKRTSIRELADKLGLSKSTVAEQLVKAEGEIVASFLDSSLGSE